ncbi:hypothetical protein GCM10010168_50670 [Actinoplanes ianthinogenes]|uniref:Transglutaminase-like domain-containing protein n=1 Tax=Actinoplanes ianthinogenes TaxID=122358 RepID=A0ABM7M3A6_9ACTN|nr:transglutaminase domain-containing protein [Actinoplanes ianthinogenes]BCJ46118.1 hypothetical protein Aiant_67750 [Actinoplanes ianthinogenes]GGR26367.1 hypothetical protein GCM10010168_50670 [Actinoplanes ianthinogenes]
MVKLLRAAVVPVALIGMLALSGVVLGRIYADDLLFRLVAGAALGSIGAGLATRRLPSWSAAPVSAVLLAGYTAVALKIAAGHAGLTTPFPGMVREALVNGIPRLLTAMIPVESTPDTVVVPVVATWLAGLAAVEVGVRARRVLLGSLTPVLLYGGALYVVGPNAGAAVGPTLGFAALVVVALAVSARQPDRPEMSGKIRARSLAGAAGGLVAVLALAAVVGPWISGQVGADPVDPRQYVEPPQVDSLDESPLNRISGWMLAPKQQLFAYQPETAPAGKQATVKVRLAVLSDYDGVTWKVGGVYRNAGRVLPAQDSLPGAETSDVRQKLTISGLTGRLLPAVATPAEVSGARVAFDPATGTLIRPEGLSDGLTYTVTSRVQSPDLNMLPTAQSPTGDAVVRYLALGKGVPESIERLAEHLADGNGGSYDRAVAIEQFLAEHYRETPDAPSGHAYLNLQYFLFGPRGQGGQEGTSEQFAASFALLARLTGLPSRVVVGFQAPAGGGQVTGGDAVAWPEVLFDGLGWVPFDPMPTSDDPTPVEQDFTPKPSTPPTTPPETNTPSTSAAASVSAAAAPVTVDDGVSAGVVAGGSSGALLVVLGLGAVVVVQLRRAQRRRRLYDGSPDERITGAWLEFTDALRLAGQPVPDHLSATEMAAYAAEPPAPRRGGLLRRAAPAPAAASPSASPVAVLEKDAAGEPLPPLDELVSALNTVGFAPGAADSGQADRAGAQSLAYAAALRERRSWWRKAWWTIHPGPLRWHR